MSNTRTEVEELPECDIEGCEEKARYDAKTKMGAWGYLCTDHFKKLGVGLGEGLGQKLMPKKPHRDKTGSTQSNTMF